MKNKSFIYKKYHYMIEGFILSFIQEHKRFPLTVEIAKELKIAESTVRKHRKEIDISNYIPQFKNMTPEIIRGLAAKARSGSASEVKLWLQYVEGWGEKTEDTNKDIEIVIELPKEMQDKDGEEHV